MASLKDLRTRIASVKSTQKITKAMQMVAAAKLRRAESAAEAARPYAERMEQVLADLAAGVQIGPDSPKLLAGTGSDKTHLMIICTAERGLCGGFNSSIARLARDHAQKLLADGKTVKMIFVGKKGFDAMSRQFGQYVVERFDLRAVRQIGFENADQIARKVFAMFEAGEFDVATLFYARFQNVLTQVPTAQQLIPVQLPVKSEASSEQKPQDQDGVVYDYEPSEEDILYSLLPRNVTVQIFRALLENGASEQGARMSAMDSATRNAGEMIKKQTIIYNRTRQAKITTELVEIISGAEAL